MATPELCALSYFFEVHSFMNLVRAAPLIFCSFACLVQSAFFCLAAALSLAAGAGAVAGAGVWAKVTPRLRVPASTTALTAYPIRDINISVGYNFFVPLLEICPERPLNRGHSNVNII
jgi:hypothetical protein